MPNLEKIIIQRCTFLESVPSGIERLTNIQVLEFFDMPQEFVHKLLPETLDGDYHKVAHIPEVYYTYWRDDAWEPHPLAANRQMSRAATRTKYQLEQVGDVGANQKNLGRVESKRWLDKRHVVRGVVMNPVNHSHGGGEGRAPIGRKKSTTPWGYPALGSKSRKMNKYSDNLILRRRSK
ncbi:Ribosomal protein L2 [Forsythia ovata]|uniref:Ribosomal protein L2 n=1 Tax=Forsythia ovata TaxID=205694 RepID=A0ABD1VJK4_9LAMI